jgi:tetratricopeptide (TPR) repeat protein
VCNYLFPKHAATAPAKAAAPGPDAKPPDRLGHFMKEEGLEFRPDLPVRPARKGTPLPGVTLIDERAFRSFLASRRAGIVFFSASWAGPSRQIESVVEEIAADYGSRIAFAEMDIGEAANERFASTIDIKVVPEFLMLRDGTLASRFRGSDPTALRKWMEQEIAPIQPSIAVADVIAFLQNGLGDLRAGSVGIRAIVERAFLRAPLTDAEWERATKGEALRGRLGWTSSEFYDVAQAVHPWFDAGEHHAVHLCFSVFALFMPRDGYFHSIIAAALAKMDRRDEAVAEYGVALALGYRTTDVFTNRGEILLQKADFENALEDLRASIELDPEGNDPFANHARSLARATSEVLKMVLAQKTSE